MTTSTSPIHEDLGFVSRLLALHDEGTLTLRDDVVCMPLVSLAVAPGEKTLITKRNYTAFEATLLVVPEISYESYDITTQETRCQGVVNIERQERKRVTTLPASIWSVFSFWVGSQFLLQRPNMEVPASSLAGLFAPVLVRAGLDVSIEVSHRASEAVAFCGLLFGKPVSSSTGFASSIDESLSGLARSNPTEESEYIKTALAAKLVELGLSAESQDK